MKKIVIVILLLILVMTLSSCRYASGILFGSSYVTDENFIYCLRIEKEAYITGVTLEGLSKKELTIEKGITYEGEYYEITSIDYDALCFLNNLETLNLNLNSNGVIKYAPKLKTINIYGDCLIWPENIEGVTINFATEESFDKAMHLYEYDTSDEIAARKENYLKKYNVTAGETVLSSNIPYENSSIPYYVMVDIVFIIIGLFFLRSVIKYKAPNEKLKRITKFNKTVTCIYLLIFFISKVVSYIVLDCYNQYTIGFSFALAMGFSFFKTFIDKKQKWYGFLSILSNLYIIALTMLALNYTLVWNIIFVVIIFNIAFAISKATLLATIKKRHKLLGFGSIVSIVFNILLIFIMIYGLTYNEKFLFTVFSGPITAIAIALIAYGYYKLEQETAVSFSGYEVVEIPAGGYYV